MAGNRKVGGDLRSRLDHPVIDSDGHWVEFGPELMDSLREVGGTKAVEGFKARPTEVSNLLLTTPERRARRLDQPVWWGLPAKNPRPRHLDASEAVVSTLG